MAVDGGNMSEWWKGPTLDTEEQVSVSFRTDFFCNILGF
jgi:hypothetical protein